MRPGIKIWFLYVDHWKNYFLNHHSGAINTSRECVRIKLEPPFDDFVLVYMPMSGERFSLYGIINSEPAAWPRVARSGLQSAGFTLRSKSSSHSGAFTGHEVVMGAGELFCGVGLDSADKRLLAGFGHLGWSSPVFDMCPQPKRINPVGELARILKNLGEVLEILLNGVYLENKLNPPNVEIKLIAPDSAAGHNQKIKIPAELLEDPYEPFNPRSVRRGFRRRMDLLGARDPDEYWRLMKEGAIAEADEVLKGA